MNIKVVLCLCLLLMLVVGSSAEITIDNVETSEYYYTEDAYSTGSGFSTSMEKFYMNVDQFQDITLITLFAKNTDFSSITPGTGSMTLYIGAITYATIDWSVLPGSTGESILHMQFNSYDRGALSGFQAFSIGGSVPGFSVPGGVSSKYAVLGSSPTSVGFYWTTSGKFMPFYESHIYHKYTGKANVYSNEAEDFISSWVQRAGFEGGNAYTSNVTYTRGDGAIMSTSNAATNTTPHYMVDEYTTLSIVFPNGYSWNKVYNTDGNYTPVAPTITPTPTPEPIIHESGCGMNIELSLSKYANIFPYENITATLAIDNTSNLTSGSKITYVIDTFNFNSPLVIATFTNIGETWHAYKNDLGIISDYDTTLSDALSENIRFSDAGYYTVSAYVDTPTGCYVYDTVSANINPTSQVNVDFYFRDAVSGDLVGSVAATIANVGITGNVSYYGNPIGIAASRYDNISIYCDHEGYETKFFYYTVPQPPYGNVLDVPVYLTPLEAPIIYADNTVLSVNVKSAESGEPLSNADVSAYILGLECDSGWTDGNGFVSLIVPFHSGYTLLSTGRFPYNSDSRYLSLNNATSYSVDVYLSYAGTPIVTPTPSYNYTPTLTPTTTDTPMPTSTVISTPLLYVHVWDADGGMSYPISSAIVTIYDGDEVDQTYKGAIMYTAYTDTAGNIEPLQIESNSAFWASISKSGYYTQIQRYRMTTGTESHIYVPLKRVGASVTVVTTQPTLVLPTPGGTGIQGGFIGWILDYFAEWFGVDNGTARILLALFIIMCSSVFVGGSLAGFGSGAGAGMGALIGGMFAFIAMCYVQFLPFWLLPIGIAFVGMAFFVWNRQDK